MIVISHAKFQIYKCRNVCEQAEVVEWNKRWSPPFPCCSVSCQCPWKKTLIEKNKKKGRIPLLSLNELIKSCERKPVLSKQGITFKRNVLAIVSLCFFLNTPFLETHRLMLKIEFCHNLLVFSKNPVRIRPINLKIEMLFHINYTLKYTLF